MLRTKDYRLARMEHDAEKNILFYRITQDMNIDVEEMVEMIGYVQDFIGEQKHYALIDFGPNLSASPESRKAYAESDYILKYRMADAFLIQSLSVRLIANFFINVTRPKIATKMFNSEEEGIGWLENLKAKSMK